MTKIWQRGVINARREGTREGMLRRAWVNYARSFSKLIKSRIQRTFPVLREAQKPCKFPEIILPRFCLAVEVSCGD